VCLGRCVWFRHPRVQPGLVTEPVSLQLCLRACARADERERTARWFLPLNAPFETQARSPHAYFQERARACEPHSTSVHNRLMISRVCVCACLLCCVPVLVYVPCVPCVPCVCVCVCVCARARASACHAYVQMCAYDQADLCGRECIAGSHGPSLRMFGRLWQVGERQGKREGGLGCPRLSVPLCHLSISLLAMTLSTSASIRVHTTYTYTYVAHGHTCERRIPYAYSFSFNSHAHTPTHGNAEFCSFFLFCSLFFSFNVNVKRGIKEKKKKDNHTRKRRILLSHVIMNRTQNSLRFFFLLFTHTTTLGNAEFCSCT